MRISVEAQGTERVARKMTLSGARAADAREAFGHIINLIFKIESQIFQSQGRRGGGSWQRLTLDWLRRKTHSPGLDTRILHATGALRRSVTERGAPHQILELSPNHLRFGTDRPGAQAHQTGTGGMPKRQFIKFTEKDRRDMRELMAKHIIRDWGSGYRGRRY